MSDPVPEFLAETLGERSARRYEDFRLREWKKEQMERVEPVGRASVRQVPMRGAEPHLIIIDEPFLTKPPAEPLPEDDGEVYIRVSGMAECQTCHKTWYQHPRVRKYDAFEGQELDLYRGCDGVLRKT